MQMIKHQARGLAMNRFTFSIGLLFGTLCSTAVQAQNLDGMKACARISNETARLNCYDTAVVAIDAALAAEIAARKQEMLAQQAEDKRLAKDKAAQDKVDNFGANNLPSEKRPSARVEMPDSLDAKIEVASYNALGNLVALLDNGQTWIQTETITLPRIKTGDEVKIKRGALGSYRMVIVRMNRAIPVKRRR
jgi:hypothetical protein